MKARSALALLVVAAVLGCTPNYSYRGVQYSSPAGVLAAQERHLDSLLNGIEPRSRPVAGQARVVIPDKKALLDRGVKPAGSPEVRDYYASIFYNMVQFVPRAIEKRNIFERVEVQETATPEFLPPARGIITIYRYVSSDADAGWYYSSETTPRARININYRTRDAAALYDSLLRNIEVLAAKEQKG